MAHFIIPVLNNINKNEIGELTTLNLWLNKFYDDFCLNKIYTSTILAQYYCTNNNGANYPLPNMKFEDILNLIEKHDIKLEKDDFTIKLNILYDWDNKERKKVKKIGFEVVVSKPDKSCVLI